jgi:hypothetical protein
VFRLKDDHQNATLVIGRTSAAFSRSECPQCHRAWRRRLQAEDCVPPEACPRKDGQIKNTMASLL